MREMKVGIEGTPLFGNLTGVGQNTKRLLEAAAKNSQHTDFEIIRQWWFFRKFAPPLPAGDHLSYRLVKWVPPIFYYQLYKRTGWAPKYDWLTFRKYNAMIFFNFVAFPVRKNTPVLLVIYDLSYALHPQYSSPKNVAYLNKFVPRSIKSATRIITISENSKKEIVDYYHVPEDKVTIINPAVDHSVFKPQSKSAVAAVAKKYRLNKPYILSVCTLEPRKNLIGVLNAFAQLPEDIKQKYSLVLVGGKGWLDGEIEERFNELSKKYSLIKTGYVPDADLPALYSGAALFVYPALYEGFGMPPLEAMACGVPVITSDNSSLPEVVGDAAIKIKAEDTPRLAKEIDNVLTNKSLAADMVKKGLVQSEKFSWDDSAKKLLEVLENLQ